MKLKTIKRQITEVETDIDLPAYLYFQDEMCNDELVMITEKHQIKVKWDFHSLIIEKSEGFAIEEHHLKNNLTTKEHFMEMYNEAVKSMSAAIACRCAYGLRG